MTDNKGNGDPDPATYERQAGEAAEVYGTDHDAQLATFNDPHPEHEAVWRPPNATEYELIERTLDGDSLDGLYVAVIDGYQTTTPGYAGPAAVVAHDEGADLIPLKEEARA